jgi:hypothetical protein
MPGPFIFGRNLWINSKSKVGRKKKRKIIIIKTKKLYIGGQPMQSNKYESKNKAEITK